MTHAIVERVAGFDAWREAAREHLLRRTPPGNVIWQPGGDGQQFLFDAGGPAGGWPEGAVRLPRSFIDTAKAVARHRDANRWSLLYRVAWRIENQQRELMLIETDDDVRALAMMRKAVERDIYKMRAFVRFRRIVHAGQEQYVAWYRPEHYTLDANERFFVERFSGMRWAILTAEASMAWDMRQVQHGPGVPRSQAPSEDEFEDLWRTYYTSIYNPARLNLDAMRAQLPVFRWEDLPESRAIPELVRISRGRLASMAQMQPAAASAFIPPGAGLPVLRDSVGSCHACELCGLATQPVFGEGPQDARLMLVGEQPGDSEDRAGRPFVGPAGQVLDDAMRKAGIDRNAAYLTNAVKAFRFEERGKRRIHQTARALHVATCRPWLEAEMSAVQPEVIVCLGATAAHSVLGRTVQIGAERGHLQPYHSGAKVIVTYHPSAILRAPDPAVKADLTAALINDLTLARLKTG